MSEVETTISFIKTIIESGLIGGTLVMTVVQFLKSNFIPSQLANKYPRITTGILSLVGALVATYAQCSVASAVCTAMIATPLGIASTAVAIFIIAVLIYNNVLRNKPQA